jgi:hypothetical protein
LYFRLYPGKEIDSNRGIAFLKALDRELNANGCLVWDRLNAHRANRTRAYLDTASRLRTFFFPSCAAELDPAEYLRSWLKMDPWPIASFTTWTRSPTPPADAPVPCKATNACCAP